ncbi:hypothetical protein [Mesorhizobium sp.]|nr:hypothetical protein [Mesorhizobium sp.]
MTGKPGSRLSIFDQFYEGLEYELVDLVYSDTPLRARVPDWPLTLPTIPLPEPDLDTASRNEVVFTGGMMGEMVAQDMGESMGPRMMQDDEFRHRLVHQRRRRRRGQSRHEAGADALAE